MSNITTNVYNILERVATAAHAAGRRPEDIAIVAVAKGHSVAEIQEAAAAGIADIGENRVQEAWPKYLELQRSVRWHMVGSLQTNKASRATEFADLIHSLDRLSLAAELSRLAVQRGRDVHCLLEVNTSGEASKHGVAPAATLDLLRQVSALPGLRIDGLMTIGPLAPDPEAARPAFQRLRELFAAAAAARFPAVDMRWLSMGMSADYPVAIAAGANLVRIGTAIFGSR